MSVKNENKNQEVNETTNYCDCANVEVVDETEAKKLKLKSIGKKVLQGLGALAIFGIGFIIGTKSGINNEEYVEDDIEEENSDEE